MDSQQFREAAISSIDEIVKYYDTIEDRRVVPTVEPGYLRKLLPEEAPEEGEAWADIQKDIETKVLPGITHWYGAHVSLQEMLTHPLLRY
ncbi:hypothetical protein F5Y19DRAFT_407316 [Xylariaceae sp. FL1651]|nr:hypothetical protein F5Y19DRAFT_407316 [Xylariaceae sp. FL1651]